MSETEQHVQTVHNGEPDHCLACMISHDKSSKSPSTPDTDEVGGVR